MYIIWFVDHLVVQGILAQKYNSLKYYAYYLRSKYLYPGIKVKPARSTKQKIARVEFRSNSYKFTSLAVIIRRVTYR